MKNLILLISLSFLIACGSPESPNAMSAVPTAPISNVYVNNGDGTLTHADSGLMLVARPTKTDGITLTYADAKTYVQNLRTGGYSDWRLPNSAEFAILPLFRSDFTPQWLQDYGFVLYNVGVFWCQEINMMQAYSYYIGTVNGAIQPQPEVRQKTQSFYVWAVR